MRIKTYEKKNPHGRAAAENKLLIAGEEDDHPFVEGN